MRKLLWALCSGTALLATTTAFATNFPETEANDTKAAANAVTLAAGDSVSGTTTGTSTTVAGLGSADYFRVKTAADAAAIYQYRLTRNAAGANTSASLRGLSQSGGVIGTTDNTLNSSTGTPPYVQWYGFGAQEEVYFRVTGSTTTTTGYQWDLSRTTITPVAGPTNLLTGNITIARGTGNTQDWDIWVYNSSFQPIATYGNDGSNALTRSYAPGTYYLADAAFNGANDQPSPADDTFRSGTVMDFPNGFATSSTTTNSNAAAAFTDSAGTQTVAATKVNALDVVWISFTVIDPVGACCFNDGSCSEGAASACTAAGGIFQGTGTTCSPNPCPQPGACCFANGSCTVNLPAQCSAASGIHQGTGTTCSPNPCPQPGRCCLPSGVCLTILESTCTAQSGTFDAMGTCPSATTYNSITTPLHISDSTTQTDTLNVGDSYVMGDVNVHLDIAHTFVGDMIIKLTHGATVVTLLSNDCGGNDNVNTTVDDQAGNLVCGTPIGGSYNPNSATAGQFLSAFAGADVNGDWVLSVQDTASGDTGQVNSWSLIVTETCLVTTEACCFGDGTCQDLLVVACASAGGVSQGPASTCTPNPCPQPEACCHPDGSCNLLLAATCTAGGGVPQGAGSSCSPNPCPQPGACCLPDDRCLVTLPADCTSLGGTPQGDGSTCPFVGAPVTYTSSPALNIPDNTTVSDNQVVADNYGIADVNVHLDITHTFVGDLILKVTHGATVVTLLSNDCGGNDNFNATVDDEAGALVCAQPVSASYNPNSATAGQFLSAFDGQNVNGTWTLSVQDTAGGDTGTVNSWSLIVSPLACVVPPEACCFADGSCQDLDAVSCLNAGGSPQGVGSSCSPNPCPQPEACCHSDGSCADLLAATCTAGGGTPQGSGSACASTTCPDLREACCFGDTHCTFVLPADCTAAGGTPMGAGTDCDSVTCPDTNPGQSCNNPIPVDIPGGLPYVDANSTQGKVNDYSNTCLGSYDSGEDIIYRLDVSDPVCITITLDGSVAGGSIWLGMGLDDTCPLGVLAGDCIAVAATSAAIDTMNVSLNPGSYYLMIDTFASPTFAAYTLTINECPQIACCIAGVCSDLTAPDCAAAGGINQGTGTTCATTECPQACCAATGACTFVAPSVCTGAGNIPQGVGSSCTPNPCPQPGRCCLDDGSCIVALPVDCAAAGGVYSAGNCIASYDVSTIAVDLIDITTSPTAVLLDYGTDDDDGQINVALPFPFTFYGNVKNALDISTNGYVTFDGNGSDFTNDNPIPNANTPNDAIYPLWDDFDLNNVDLIWHDTQGSIGSRVFIVLWNGVGQYNSGSAPLDANTFELKLFEADNCIEFHYGLITQEGVAPSTPAGTDYTIGVENSAGTGATQIQGAAIGTGGTARRLCYNAQVCPQPVACCYADGHCEMHVAANCTADGGNPQGSGSSCSPNLCPQPDGCLGYMTGDADCDGFVNNFDIDKFVQGVVFGVTAALPPDVPPTAPAGYLAIGGTEDCWAHRRCWGDINCDGVLNNFDIDPFVACVVATPPPTEPCGGLATPSCPPQACCFSGGSCAMVRPAGCILSGGVPQGSGTNCGSVVCP